MNLTDIVALAKQGYKPADIKELMAMATETETVKEAEQTPTAEPVAEPEAPKETPKAEEKDFGIYEQRIADLEAKLAQAQKANITQNVNGTGNLPKSDEETFAELARAFM